jgi:hypothetical protein
MTLQHKALVRLGGMLLAMGALALAGCSITPMASRSTATTTATPTGATILEAAVHAQKTQTKDVEFSMNTDLTTSGTTISGQLTGTETSSPKRVDIVITNFTVAGLQFAGEIITDAATSSIYVKFTSSNIAEIPQGQWIKTRAGSSSNPLPIDPVQFSDLSQLKGVTLKGSETLDGIAVWHLQTTKMISGSTTLVDIYIRKDSNQLYEVVANATGTSSGSVKLKITGVNTGATITLPPADQVVTQ